MNSLVTYQLHSLDENIVKWIWWYDITQDRLEGYPLKHVEKHSSSVFTLISNDYNKCIRGRIIHFEDKNYLVIWSPGYLSYPISIIEKLVIKVEKQFEIDFIIDEVSREIFKKQ